MSISQSWRNITTAYRLLATECSCGYRSFPPKEICIKCGKESDLKLIPYCGMDRSSMLVAHSHRISDFEDIIPGLVDIDGLTFPTRITDTRAEELIIGLEMEPTFRRLSISNEGLINYGTIFRPGRWEKPPAYRSRGEISEKAGIVSYGVHLPYYRLKMTSIDREYRVAEGTNQMASGYSEKTVPNFDQDPLTMGVDSTRLALNMAGKSGEGVDSIYFGTTNRPYRMKASAITLGEAIGANPHIKAMDVECSQRGASSSILDAVSVVDNPTMGISESLVVGSDTPRVKEGDQLDVGAAAGSVSILIGKEDPIARIIGFETFTTDIPDQWWSDESSYPTTSGRFQGKPAYYKHLVNAARILMIREGLKTDDLDHVILHHPTLSFAKRAARKLDVDPRKLTYLDSISRIGNPFNSSTLISLASVLDKADPGERILTVHYGSGGGADAILLETTENLPEKRESSVPVETQLEHMRYISYYTYRKRN